MRTCLKIFVFLALMLNINCLAIFWYANSYYIDNKNPNFITVIDKKCSNHNQKSENNTFFIVANKDDKVVYDIEIKKLDYNKSDNLFFLSKKGYLNTSDLDAYKYYYITNYYHNLVWIIKSNT